ncbi:hypothetical protein [uncultured Litoreibacter sp.]|uniref:hypothetical protein n=1 Tax=uncultured Litoreibacter sp. TaxID=1392394 RepID=UPI002619D697|nr:hypothetical protein [uncultured Litoreibacter sp.]
MHIKILSWAAKGLRGALESFQIDLSDDLKPIALIQMPTGTGKTTTISLLRKAISGEDFDKAEIRSLRAESGPGEGFFELVLLLDQAQAKVRIEFDFQNETFLYTTILTPGGNRRGHDLPRPYDRLLDRNLTRLFVFDGELAADLRNQDMDQADEAIEALYRLSVLKKLKDDAEETLDKQRKQNKHIKGHKSNVRDKKRAERDEAAECLERLKARRSEIFSEKIRIDADLTQLSREITNLADHNKEVDASYNSAKDAVGTAAAHLDERHSFVSGHFLRPQNLHPKIATRLSTCYDQIEAAKLPGPSSKVWFDWLAQQDECVCGRSLEDHKYRDAILDQKEKYLGGEQHQLINEIKHALKVGATATNISKQSISDLDAATGAYRDAIQQLREAQDRRVRAAGGDIDEMRERERRLSTQSRDFEKALSLLDSNDAENWRDSIPLCTRELERREEARNEADDTFETYRKVKLLNELLDDVLEATIFKVRKTIQTRTNDKLSGIIHAEDLTIDAIDSALRLTGISREREDVSVGQSLAVAYAFLTSLFEHASYRLPFIVDSPAGPIDIETRKSVSNLLPQMFPQLIMFVQSGEREGFVEAFYQRNDVSYLTCWRESDDIKVVTGRPAFEAFHSNEDGASVRGGNAT